MRLLALACHPTSDAELIAESIAELTAGRPKAAAAICLQVSQTQAAAECAWSVAAVVAESDPAAATAICRTLSGAHADECAFVVAEASQDPELCSGTGGLEVKCQLHFYRDGLSAWVPPDARVGQVDGLAQEHMTALGLAVETEAAWFRTYRYVLAHTAEDTTTEECQTLGPIRARACERALEMDQARPGTHRP
ncbi:MAG TPA: hypothetical protein QGF58_03265 [Myxococcota bacterium]|nr:hypothetical protein [Myxococcota bacterium]